MNVENIINGNSFDHLYFFIEKLEKNEPFAIIRPNDGEFMILRGQHFITQDGWKFTGGKLTDDLRESIHRAATLPNMFIGIPCPACWNNGDTQWYINTFGLKAGKNLTYGNIVCNFNWRYFTEYFTGSKKAFYYIGPGKNTTTALNITDKYIIDEYQVHRWDTEGQDFIRGIETWVADKITSTSESVQLFMVSAGPLTKIIIPRLFAAYPNNQFIDCGSALDLFLKGASNRKYINISDEYAQIICDFSKGHI
jgi:hypothetical protein